MKSEIEKNQLKAIINGMKIAKYFDGIIKANKKKTQKTMNFDDMMIFKKNNNKKFEIESILLENINPCFKFYIVKNLQLLESLINSKLNNDNFKELFNQSGECFIPFWVFLIRNMSSLNCVCYDNEKNPFSDEITKEVRKKIKDLLKDGENKKLDNGWLNLIVKDIPNKIININVRLFYDFFNDLINNLKETNSGKAKINNILKDFYLELIKYQFEGKMNDILNECVNSSNNKILKFIKVPQEYIKNNLENYLRRKP